MDRLKFCMARFCLAITATVAVTCSAWAQPGNDLGAVVGQDVSTGGFLNGTYFDIRSMSNSGVGYKYGYSQFGAFTPFINNGDWLVAANARMLVTDNSSVGGNFGGVARYYSSSMDRIFGGYGYYDTDESVNHYRYNQATFGIETIGQFLDFRLNAYIPTKQGDNFVSRTGINASNPVFQNNGIYVQGLTLNEGALNGGDFEFGTPLLPGQSWLRGYAGMYMYHGADRNPTGVRVRAEAWISNDLSIGVNATDDRLYGTNVNAVVSWQFAGLLPTRYFPQYTVREKMMMPVQRNWRIATGLHQGYELVQATNPATGNPYFLTWVDNSAGSGGNGSYEHPYTSLPGSAPGSDLILVRVGNSLTTPITGNLALFDNQKVWGEGIQHSVTINANFGDYNLGFTTINLPGFNNTGVAPVVSNSSGPTFNLANNNEISSLRIQNSLGGPAITGNGINNFNLNNLTMTNVAGGISISNATGTGLINQVAITGSQGNGIDLSAGPAGLSTFLTSVSSNSGTGTGIRLTAELGPLNTTMLNVNATGNADSGINLISNGQTLTAALSTINASGNTNYGLLLQGTNGQQIINASDVTADRNGLGNLLSSMTNTNTQATFSGINSFSSSLGGPGIALFQNGGTSNYSLYNTASNQNAGDGLQMIASNGSLLSVNFLNGTLDNNLGNATTVVASGGSTINYVDPSSAINAGVDGFNFTLTGGSTLNANLGATNFSGAQGNGIIGFVDASTANVFMQDSLVNNVGRDGLSLTANNGSLINFGAVGGSFANAGLNAGSPNRNAIELAATANSAINMSLIGTVADHARGNGLLFSADASALNLNVTDGSFDTPGANGVRGSLNHNSTAQLTMVNTAASGAGNNGMFIDAQNTSNFAASITSGAFSNAGQTSNGNAVRLDLASNSTGNVFLENTGGANAGGDGLLINATNSTLLFTSQNTIGNNGSFSNSGQTGTNSNAAVRVNANASGVALNLIGVSGENTLPNVTQDYGYVANIQNGSTLISNLSNGSFNNNRLDAFNFNIAASNVTLTGVNVTGAFSGRDGLHVDAITGSNFTGSFTSGDFSDSGSANSVTGIANAAGNATELNFNASTGNLSLTNTSGARAGGDGLAMSGVNGSNLTVLAQNNGTVGTVTSFADANQANTGTAGAVKVVGSNSTLALSLVGVSGNNNLPYANSNYGINATLQNKTLFTANVSDGSFDNNRINAFNFNANDSSVSLNAINATGKLSGNDGLHIDAVNSIFNASFVNGDFSDSGSAASVLGVASGTANAAEINFTSSIGGVTLTNTSGANAGGDGLLVNALNSNLTVIAQNDGSGLGTVTSFANANQAGNATSGAVNLSSNNSILNLALVGVNGNNTLPYTNSNYGIQANILNGSLFTANVSNGSYDNNRINAFKFNVDSSSMNFNADTVTGARSGVDGLHLDVNNSASTIVSFTNGDFSDSGSANSVLGVANSAANAAEINFTSSIGSVTLTNTSGSRAGGNGLFINTTNSQLNVIAQNDTSGLGTTTSFDNANQSNAANLGAVRINSDSSLLGVSLVGVSGNNTLPYTNSYNGVAASILNNSAFTLNLSNSTFNNNRADAFNFNVANSTANVNALNVTGAFSGIDGLHVDAINSIVNASFVNGDFSDSGSANSVLGVANSSGNAVELNFSNSTGNVTLTNTSGSRAGGDGLKINATTGSNLTVIAQNDTSGLGTTTSFDNAGQFNTANDAAVRVNVNASALSLALVGVSGNNTLPYTNQEYGIIANVVNNSAFTANVSNGAFDNNRISAFSFNADTATVNFNGVDITGARSGADGLKIVANNSIFNAGFINGDFSDSGSANSVTGVVNGAANAADISFTNSSGAITLTNTSGSRAGGDGLLINATGSVLSVLAQNNGSGAGTITAFDNANQIGNATSGAVTATASGSTLNLSLVGVNGNNTGSYTNSNYGVNANISASSLFNGNFSNGAFDNSRISAFNIISNTSTVNINALNTTGARSGDDGLHIAATNSIFNAVFNGGDFSDSGSANSVTGVVNGNANAADISFTGSNGSVVITNASGSRAGGDGLLINALNSQLNVVAQNDSSGIGTTTSFDNANQANVAGAGAVNVTSNNSQLGVSLIGASGNNTLPYANSNYGFRANISNNSIFQGNVSNGAFDNNRVSAFFITSDSSTVNFNAIDTTGSKSGEDGLHIAATNSLNTTSIVNATFTNGDFSDSGSANSVLGVASSTANAVDVSFNNTFGTITLTNASGSRAGGDGLLLSAVNNSNMTFIGQTTGGGGTVTSFDSAGQSNVGHTAGVRTTVDNSTLNLSLLGVSGNPQLPNLSQDYGFVATVLNNSVFTANLSNGSYDDARVSAFFFNVANSSVTFNATGVTGARSGVDGLHIDAINSIFNLNMVNGDLSDSGSAGSVIGIANANGNAAEINFNNSSGTVSLTNTSGSRAGGDGLLINDSSSILTVFAQNDGSGLGTVSSFDNANQAGNGTAGAVTLNVNHATLNLALVGASGNNALGYANSNYGINANILNNSAFTANVSNGAFDRNRINAFNFNVNSSLVNFNAVNATGNQSGDDGLHIDATNSSVTAIFNGGDFSDSGSVNSVTGVVNANANAQEINFTNSIGSVTVSNASGINAGGTGLLINANNSQFNVIAQNDGTLTNTVTAYTNANQSNTAGLGAVRVNVNNNSVVGLSLVGASGDNAVGYSQSYYGLQASVQGNSSLTGNVSNASFNRNRVNAFDFNVSGTSLVNFNAVNATGNQSGDDGLHIDAINSTVNATFNGGDFSDSGSANSVTGVVNGNANAVQLAFNNSLGNITVTNASGNNAGGDGLLINAANNTLLNVIAQNDGSGTGTTTAFNNANQIGNGTSAAVNVAVNASTLNLSLVGASGNNTLPYTNSNYGLRASVLNNSLLTGNFTNGSFDNNRINAFNFNVDSSAVTFLASGVTGAASGSDGLHIDATSSNAANRSNVFVSFANGNFSDSGSAASVLGIASGTANTMQLSFNNSTGNVFLTDVIGDRAGGDGLQILGANHSILNVTTTGTGLNTSSFNNNSQAGGATDAGVNASAVSNSTVSVALNNTSIQNTSILSPQDYGLLLNANTVGVLNISASSGLNLSGNSLNGINATVSDVGSMINMVSLTNVTADQNGGTGAIINISNGGVFNGRFLGGSFSNNGLLSPGDGFQVNSDGINGANRSMANVVFDGTQASNNTLNGFNFQATNQGSVNALLQTTGVNGVLTASNNVSNGINFNVGANSVGLLLMNGNNVADFNGSTTGGNGVNVTSTNGNTLITRLSGSYDSNGQAGVGGNGINVNLTNVTNAAVEMNGGIVGTINSNANNGINVVLNNQTLTNQAVGAISLNGQELIPAITVGALDIESFVGNSNLAVGNANQNNGIQITAVNSTIQAGTGRIAFNQFTHNVNGDGLGLSLNNSFANNFTITNNLFSNNGGNGININLNGSSMTGLNIVNNTQTTGPSLGLSFQVTGDTASNPWTVSNTSVTASELLTNLAINIAPSGNVFNTTGNGAQPFQPVAPTDVNTGLTSVNSSFVTAGTNPLQDNFGNVLVGGGVADQSSAINLGFNNFGTSQSFAFLADADPNGGSGTVNGNNLAGSTVTATYTGGYTLTGTLAANGNQGLFSVVSTPIILGGISNNGLDGIRFNLTNSDLTGLNVDTNTVTGNGTNAIAGGNGINFFSVVNSDITGTFSNNTITGQVTNNGQGDGIRLINPVSNTLPIVIDYIGNTITGNNVGIDIANNQNNSVSGVMRSNLINNTISANRGDGISINLTGGSTFTGANWYGNTIGSAGAGNSGLGVHLFTGGSSAFDITFGDSAQGANLVGSNVGAGIGIQMTGTAANPSNFTIQNTTISNTSAGVNTTFTGDGLSIAMSNTANLGHLSIGDTTLANTTFTENARDGVRITGTNSALIDSVNGNIVFANVASTNNIQNGVNIDMQAFSGIGTVTGAGTVTFTSIGGTDAYSGNGSNGLGNQIRINRQDAAEFSNTILTNLTVTGTATSLDGLSYNISNGLSNGVTPPFNLLVDNSNFTNNLNGIQANLLASVEVNGHINSSIFDNNRSFGITFNSNQATSFGGPLGGYTPYTIDANEFSNNGNAVAHTGGGIFLNTVAAANSGNTFNSSFHNIRMTGVAARQTFTNNQNGIQINNTSNFSDPNLPTNANAIANGFGADSFGNPVTGSYYVITGADFTNNFNGVNINSLSGSTIDIGGNGLGQNVTQTGWQNDGIIASISGGTHLNITSNSINNVAGTPTTGVDGINIAMTGTTTVNLANSTIAGSGTNGVVFNDTFGSSQVTVQNNLIERNASGRGIFTTVAKASGGGITGASGSSTYTIGGLNAGQGNTIRSNGEQGVLFNSRLTSADGGNVGGTATGQAIDRLSSQVSGVDLQNAGNYGAQILRDTTSPDVVTTRFDVLGNQINANGQAPTAFNTNNADGTAFLIGSSTRLNMNYSGNSLIGNVGSSMYLTAYRSVDPRNSVNNGPNNNPPQAGDGVDVSVFDPVAHLDLVFGGNLAATPVPGNYNSGDRNLTASALSANGIVQNILGVGQSGIFLNNDPAKGANRSVLLYGQVQDVNNLNNNVFIQTGVTQIMTNGINGYFDNAPFFNQNGPTPFPDPTFPP